MQGSFGSDEPHLQIRVKDIEEKKEEVFHPFVLEFKIEDESDLEDLVARFNLPKMTVDDINEEELGCDCKATLPYNWGVFNKIFREKPYMK